MNKSDLTSGMELEFEDKTRKTVLLGTDDGDIFVGLGDDFGYLSDYDDDLNPLVKNQKKIIKIYKPVSHNGTGIVENTFTLELVWETQK